MLIILLLGWLLCILGFVFHISYTGKEWDGDAFGPLVFIICVGWSWPILLAALIAVGLLFLPCYGVHKWAQKLRARNQ